MAFSKSSETENYRQRHVKSTSAGETAVSYGGSLTRISNNSSNAFGKSEYSFSFKREQSSLINSYFTEDIGKAPFASCKVKDSKVTKPIPSQCITLPRKETTRSHKAQRKELYLPFSQNTRDTVINQPTVEQYITLPRTKSPAFPKQYSEGFDCSAITVEDNNGPNESNGFIKTYIPPVEQPGSILENEYGYIQYHPNSSSNNILFDQNRKPFDQQQNHLKGSKNYPINSTERVDNYRPNLICCWIFLALIILVGIGVGIYFLLFERNALVLSFTVNANNNKPFQTELTKVGNTVRAYLEVELELVVEIKNNGFFTHDVEDLEFAAFILANVEEINQGSQTPAERVLKMKNQNKIPVTKENRKQFFAKASLGARSITKNMLSKVNNPLIFSYQPSKDGALNDPIFNEVMLACIESNENGNVREIEYEYQFSEKGKVIQTGTRTMICPFQNGALASLVAAVANLIIKSA